MDINSNGYDPQNLQIAPGDTVHWINQDLVGHTVTSSNNLWSTGFLFDYMSEFTLTFNSAGTYPYYCQYAGFTGIVVVGTAAPPNDQCGSAVSMVHGTLYSVNTAGATSTGDPAVPCASFGKGVWYTYTPATNGLVSISTCSSDFDTVLSAYTGTCGALSAVTNGCNDDNGPACTSSSRASVAFSGTAGTSYRILAGGFGGASGELKIVVGVAAPPVSTWQEAQVSFDIGPSIALPNTNRVLVIDKSNDRLLTLDTASGSFVSSLRLYGKLANSGLMCGSSNGQVLYVPLNTSNKLQVISLSTLTTTDLVPITVAPTSVAAGSDGALYTMVSNQITKIDPISGQNLGAVMRNFSQPLIKANASGSRLYIMELGVSALDPKIYEYAVTTSALPSYVNYHYFSGKENDKDFVIAEDIGWLYANSGGVYGVGAWNMNTRTYHYWPYGSAYGVAVAMVPNDSVVYGASGSPDPRIRSFNRLTGSVSNTFDVNAAGRGSGAIYDRSLQVTPNGRIFYARATRKIGLIGATALNTNIPVTAEVIDAGTNKTVVAGDVFTLSAIAPGASGADAYSWSKIAGPGQVTFSASNSLTTTVQLAAPGNYTLEIVRSNGGWLSRDRLLVTATPRPIRFDPVGLSMGGQFQMRLRSEPGSFQIQASTNLLYWETITNVNSPAGDVTIADPITNRPYRFYRARLN